MENHLFIPLLPPKKMLILGIDDAGRGPVIGPMVLAGCLMKEDLTDLWRTAGVKDSKQVPKKKREELAEKIMKESKYFYVSITSASEIDSRLKSGMNLNHLEALKSAEIINALNLGEMQKEKIKVVVDCPSPNTAAWRRTLMGYIEYQQNLEVLCEHKADVNHVACSAGSILAKTSRDHEIEKIKALLGVDFGSGYPSDPFTQKFLSENLEKYRKEGIFRESWQTFKTEEDKKIQKKLGEF